MLNDNKCSFINIYASNKDNSLTHFYNYLKFQLQFNFNYINDRTLYHTDGDLIVNKQYKQIGTCIKGILAKCHLKDIWRIQNQN